MTADVIPDFAPAEDILLSERAVAGAAMHSALSAEVLADVVQPEHFRDHKAAAIYAAALALAGRGEAVDPVTVLAELRVTGALAVAGGGNYVHDCMAAVLGDVRVHAERVAADWRRRHAAMAVMSGLDHLTSPGFDPATGFEYVRKLIDDALAPAGRSDVRSMSEIVVETIRQIEEGGPRGLSTPWPDLDAVITGLVPGQMIIIAARPSIGKSIMGGQLAAHAALKLGLPALLMSMEMSAEELTMRLIASEARVPLSLLLRSEVTLDSDWTRILKKAQEISESPLVIDDFSDCSLGRIRSRIRGMQRGAGCSLLVVDYLGLMTAPKAENRQNQVAILSRELKKTAREFGIPVVVLAQLNRAPDLRSDRKPVLADLKDSGSQEADADTVLLLHQEEDMPGELQVIVAKQRQGPRHVTVTLGFQGHYARCTSLAREDFG